MHDATYGHSFSYALTILVLSAGGKCVDGFKKIAGECLECLDFNWQVVAQSLVMNMFVALFLLHKSVTPVISSEEIWLIWKKVRESSDTPPQNLV